MLPKKNAPDSLGFLVHLLCAHGEKLFEAGQGNVLRRAWTLESARLGSDPQAGTF